MDNVAKLKTANFQMGAIRLGMSHNSFGRYITGEGATYWKRLRRRVPFPDCWVNMKAGSMTEHCHRLNVTKPEINWYSLPVIHNEHLPQVYKVRFTQDTSNFQCLLPRCPGSFRSRSGLRNHSKRIHLQDSIQILKENPVPYPHCEMCG